VSTRLRKRERSTAFGQIGIRDDSIWEWIGKWNGAAWRGSGAGSSCATGCNVDECSRTRMGTSLSTVETMTTTTRCVAVVVESSLSFYGVPVNHK
jgi:hypothetical protein